MSLLRTIFLSASQSAWLRDRAPRLGFVRRTAGRFLPGEDADAALAAARTLAESGVITLLTHLGENVASRDEAAAVTNQYLRSDRARPRGGPAFGNFRQAHAARPRSRRRILLRESRQADRELRIRRSRRLENALDRHRAEPLHRRHARTLPPSPRGLSQCRRMRPGLSLSHRKGRRLPHRAGRHGPPRERRLQRACGNRLPEKIRCRRKLFPPRADVARPRSARAQESAPRWPRTTAH